MDSIFVKKKRMWDGKRLLQLRQAKGLSRESLGMTVRIHPRTIENYERGENDPKRSVPDLDTAEALADGLMTTVAYLSGEIEDSDRGALKKMIHAGNDTLSEDGGTKNYRLRSGSGELADPDLMRLLEEKLKTMNELIREKQKQIRSNSGSGNPDSKGD